MKRNVFTASPESSIASVAETMKREGIGFLPIVDPQQRVVGVVTDRDIAVRGFTQNLPPQSRVELIMTTNLVTCLTDDELALAEARMIEHRKWRLLVVDKECRLAGILTLVDVAHSAGPFKAGLLLRHLVDRDYRLEIARQQLT
jgi:CBS domain-containing protein